MIRLSRIAETSGVVIALWNASAHANVTFKLIPDPGTPQYAVDGFTAAANLWSTVLADNITITIEVGFTSLGPGIIGSTGPAFIEKSYTDVLAALQSHASSPDDLSSYAGLQLGPSYNRLINHTSDNPNGANSDVPYVDTMGRVGLTTANAKVLGLLPDDNSVDATIVFSPDFSFDFSHGTTINPGQYDFVGAAAHEIGHVLGFVSGVDDIDSLKGVYPGGDFSSNLVDLFRYSQASLAAGTGYPDYTADNRMKYFSVDGGIASVALFSNGLTYGDGHQASHWKDNLGIGIMDPTAGLGERLSISPTDLRLFDVLGFTLAPEPGTGTIFGVGLLFLLVCRRCRRAE